MRLSQTLKSEQDQSVNFIFEGEFPGFIEARYVRRSPDYFIAYLSSQTGCNQGCRQCHLTATKQTQLRDVNPVEFETQAKTVIDYYLAQEGPKAEVIHFNFMVRGEPLANQHLIRKYSYGRDYNVLEGLSKLALSHGLRPKFLISTIFPREMEGKRLIEMFPSIHPEIYYSIYSYNDSFRKKWMPKALPLDDALDILCQWQQDSRKIVKLHWAFIKGENDRPRDVSDLCWVINACQLRADINIVRYNPYSEEYGEESDPETLEANIEMMRENLPKETKIKVVSRVGEDVYASCGMFVER